MLDAQSVLDFGGKIDERVNILDKWFSIGEDGAGAPDIVPPGCEDLPPGEYIHLPGMPGGCTNENGEEVSGVFDMSSIQGSLAVGLYQMGTDTMTNTLTSAIDQGKATDAKVQKSAKPM